MDSNNVQRVLLVVEKQSFVQDNCRTRLGFPMTHIVFMLFTQELPSHVYFGQHPFEQRTNNFSKRAIQERVHAKDILKLQYGTLHIQSAVGILLDVFEVT